MTSADHTDSRFSRLLKNHLVSVGRRQNDPRNHTNMGQIENLLVLVSWDVDIFGFSGTC
jgi:hypothetical protein